MCKSHLEEGKWPRKEEKKERKKERKEEKKGKQ